MLPRLDPNDPSIIIGIPEEPVLPTPDSIANSKDGKKVSISCTCNLSPMMCTVYMYNYYYPLIKAHHLNATHSFLKSSVHN